VLSGIFTKFLKFSFTLSTCVHTWQPWTDALDFQPMNAYYIIHRQHCHPGNPSPGLRPTTMARSQPYSHYSNPNRKNLSKNEHTNHWIPAELSERHHEIKRLLFLGLPNKEIAQRLNVSEINVSFVKNSPAMQAELLKLREAADTEVVSIKKRITELAPRAIEVLAELMDKEGESSKDRIKIATDLLDRAGFAPVKETISHTNTTVITGSEILELKERARQAAAENGSIEEAQVIRPQLTT